MRPTIWKTMSLPRLRAPLQGGQSMKSGQLRNLRGNTRKTPPSGLNVSSTPLTLCGLFICQVRKVLSTVSYSLNMFVYILGYVIATMDSLPPVKSLRLGLTLLQRMKKLRLSPVDEICFRVMMQLCGVHNQPNLAMEVMAHMNTMGMVPNAVTYGHYNKAVLESVWPDSIEINRFQKLWNKLSLVLDVCRRFRQCGRDAGTVNSFSRERQQLNKVNQIYFWCLFFS